MSLQVEVFVSTSSGNVSHPSVEVKVPKEYKIIGGGAFDHGTEPGNILTAAYPKDLNTWYVAGKDHLNVSVACISGFAIAVYDPKDEWDVIITKQASTSVRKPKVTALLQSGYTLTGGGAFVDWKGGGNLLTASFPEGKSAWSASSTDLELEDPSVLTAYAIGMKHRQGKISLKTEIQEITGVKENHPAARVCLDFGWILSGGGAADEWGSGENFLTASYPQDLCWLAAGKDHKNKSPGSMKAYAIGIQEV